MRCSGFKTLGALAVFSAAVLVVDQSRATTEQPATNKPGTSAAVQGKALAPYQNELLMMAFDVASAIPISPHVKDRSKTQQWVVNACLAIGQFARAARYASKIEDWRQGASFADLSLKCAEWGDEQGAKEYLARADRVADAAGLVDWRRDEVRVRIARAYTVLGELEKARQYEDGIEIYLAGLVEVIRARHDPVESFDDQVRRLDKLITSQRFEVVRNALDAYAQLYGRYYANSARRAWVEEKIKTGYGPLPLFMRVELLMGLAAMSLDHDDKAQALRRVHEAQDIVDRSQWPADYHIPLIARLSALRYRAGDQDRARHGLESALTEYETKRVGIINIDRAGVLRPIAEAYKTMDNRATALAIYAKAIEAGVENPNSRPRAEDLAATCCSMAVNAVEPDARLWARMRAIFGELRDPW